MLFFVCILPILMCWVVAMHQPCSFKGLPLLNKKVYQREQEVAAMRDAQYAGEADKASAKDAARDSRLKRGH